MRPKSESKFDDNNFDHPLPIVFVGALFKLVGRGRWAGAGSAIAGFALILIGLTTLQQGMSGVADQLHPADLPNVLNEAGFVPWSGTPGVLLLVAVGIVMTTVMQSSTAAIAVTLSALYAGAVGLDQAQWRWSSARTSTATSSAVAAIGASSRNIPSPRPKSQSPITRKPPACRRVWPS